MISKCTNRILLAKQDYKSGNYTWHCLKQKYPELSIDEIFRIIFEVKQQGYNRYEQN